MATRTYEAPLQTPEEDNETGTFVSILAGIGSGLFKNSRRFILIRRIF